MSALTSCPHCLEADSRLTAYRLALAREFPPNADGDYDVGSVHANVRQLKEDYRLLRDSGSSLITLVDAGDNQCVTPPDLRVDSLLFGEHIVIQLTTHVGAPSWAVRTHVRGICLSIAGEWEEEPSPSSRSDVWLRAHRFPNLEAAVSAAKSALNPME